MGNANVEQLVRDIVTHRCEGADNPHGSILSLDFGPLALRADDAAGAIRHGWRHLTVLSPWRVQSQAAVLCDWNTDGGVRGGILPVIRQLVGATVLSAETAAPAWDLRIAFDNGWQLVVFGDSRDDRDDAWFILGTDGAEVGAAPVMQRSAP